MWHIPYKHDLFEESNDTSDEDEAEETALKEQEYLAKKPADKDKDNKRKSRRKASHIETFMKIEKQYLIMQENRKKQYLKNFDAGKES